MNANVIRTQDETATVLARAVEILVTTKGEKAIVALKLARELMKRVREENWSSAPRELNDAIISVDEAISYIQEEGL